MQSAFSLFSMLDRFYIQHVSSGIFTTLEPKQNKPEESNYLFTSVGIIHNVCPSEGNL